MHQHTDNVPVPQRFQKEAIVRQMQEYKRERNNLEAQLNTMTKSALHHDEHLMMIDAWFSEVSRTIYIHDLLRMCTDMAPRSSSTK